MRVSPATALARVRDAALDLVFPPRCVGCGSFGAFICESCLTTASRALPPRCGTCWMPDPHDPCVRCLLERPAFTAVRSVFVYGGAAREAVHGLKYNGLSAIAPLMGGLMAERLLEWQPPVSAIVPVPLWGARKRQRGYNQSELLAREVSQGTGIPLAKDALKRVRNSVAQVQQPDEDSRRRNVAGVFGPGSQMVAGAALLIDDVITTGATLDACARALTLTGAEAVYALTFAGED